jgi:hypothetical protein
VNLFVLSVEIEDRDEIGTGRSTKRCSTLNDIHILFYLLLSSSGSEHINIHTSNFK